MAALSGNSANKTERYPVLSKFIPVISEQRNRLIAFCRYTSIWIDDGDFGGNTRSIQYTPVVMEFNITVMFLIVRSGTTQMIT